MIILAAAANAKPEAIINRKIPANTPPADPLNWDNAIMKPQCPPSLGPSA